MDIYLLSSPFFSFSFLFLMSGRYHEERIVGVTSDKDEQTQSILSSTLFSNPRVPPACSFTLHHQFHQLIEKLSAFSARITAYNPSPSFHLLLTYPPCLQSYLWEKMIIQCPCLKLFPLQSFAPLWKIKTQFLSIKYKILQHLDHTYLSCLQHKPPFYFVYLGTAWGFPVFIQPYTKGSHL